MNLNQSLKPDVLVHGGRSVFLFDPVSDRGKEWVDRNVSYEPYQRFGGAIAVEHRYIDDLVEGAVSDGLVVE